jgi:PAS domain S-box-containing protein
VNVSERVKLIESLKIHGNKLEQITSELKKVQVAVENASDIIFITDEKGKIIYINKAIKNILGHKQKELIGKKPNFWMEDMPNKFFRQMWQKIYFDKEPFIGEIQDRKKDGDLFTAEIRIAPVLDKNGKILSFVGIERDITEAKRLDTAKTEFISLAAHQLRTPITTVNLTAELLLGGLSGKINKETEEHLQEIMVGVKKMSEMVELFLNVSRIEMKTFEVLPRPLNVAKIIEENIKYIMPQIKKKDIELRKNISKNLPIVNVDHNVMDIILDNLLSNAIKYTPSNGVIKVEAEKEMDNLIIKVSDTGCGILKKYHENIFEKLFRAENMAQKVAGVGLGLYLCKALIEQAGGKIWLDSETNKGSTFFVSIPLNGMRINKRAKHN